MLDWMQPALRPVHGLPFIRTGVELAGSHFEHNRMISIKRTYLWLCLIGLGLLASSTPVSAGEVDIGFHANCVQGGVQAHLGPWFSYFPYDAYFQMPAPVPPYPHWPTPFPPPPMMAPANGFQAPPPMAAPPLQPVGYGYQMPYWYGY